MPRSVVEEKQPSHTDRELMKQLPFLFFIQTIHPQHGAVYLYVAVNGDKLEAFKKALESGRDVEVERYGTIFASGYGVPTEEEMLKVEAMYGIRHDQMMIVPLTRPGAEA